MERYESSLCCLFFQAEDGIRARNVTGVQTCALPIYTNCDPDEVDYPIPGNDDAIRSVSLLTRVVADAVADGLLVRSGASEAPGEQKTAPEEPLAEWERELLEGKDTTTPESATATSAADAPEAAAETAPDETTEKAPDSEVAAEAPGETDASESPVDAPVQAPEAGE